MAVLDLRLFGVPRLFLDGEEVVISRPRVFECLARIILAGPDGITRSELCRKLWPEFEVTDARAQLRGTLMKLRAELEKSLIASQFELGGETVRVIGAVSCDVIKFTANLTSDLSNVRTAVQPVAKSWEGENWREESDRVADALATAFDKMKTKDACVAVELLGKAVQSHPTSTRLVNLLVRRLENLNRIDEANQAIIAFEDAWVDRFGNVDLPKITITPATNNQTFTTKHRLKDRNVVLPLVGFAAVAVVPVLLFGMQVGGHQAATSESDLRIVSLRSQTQNGYTIDFVRLTTGDSRVEGLTRFSDGGINIRSSKDHSERQEVISPNGVVTPGPRFPAILKDRADGSSLVSDNSRSAHLTVDHRAVQFQGTAQLPFFDPIRIMGVSRVLGTRVSNDPFRSRSATVIAEPSGVNILRPTPSAVQVVVPTFWNKDHLFLSYSGGRSEGWQYHASKYSFDSKLFDPLPYPHVAYELSKGTLVVLPEVTSAKDGDYDTHWDGRVLFVRSGRAPEEVSIHGVNKFEFAGCFADSLVVQTSHTSGFRNVQIVSIEGVKAPFELPSRVVDLYISPDRKALIYREFEQSQESDRYVLLNELPH